jgi:hypothetical protein
VPRQLAAPPVAPWPVGMLSDAMLSAMPEDAMEDAMEDERHQQEAP